MKKSRFLVALVAILLCASPAYAYTFDLTGPYSASGSFDIFDSTNSVSVHVTGFTSAGAKTVVQTPDWGLGVYEGGLDPVQIDGIGRDETLRFDLGSVGLVLQSITFTRVHYVDDFRLNVDGSTLIASMPVPGGNAIDFGTGTFVVNPAVYNAFGHVFDFTVPGDLDGYMISSLTFVPEPGTLLLLGSGLLGLATRRRSLARAAA